MDTDIDNYSNNEILGLLRLNTGDCTEEALRTRVKEALVQVQSSGESDVGALEEFFRQCYLRVAVARGFLIEEKAREELALPPLPKVEEREVTEAGDSKEIVERKVYAGSVPASEPLTYAVNTTTSEYTRGLNDPIRRDTVTYTLVLSSKFRANLNQSSLTRTQGDRLRLRTYCATTNYKIKGIRDTLFPGAGCPTIENNASRGLTTDFTVELEEPYDNVVSIRAAGLEFMNSRYNITEALGTNQLRVGGFVYNTTTGAITVPIQWETIELQDGFYDVASIITAINAGLAASSIPAVTNVIAELDLSNPLQRVVFKVDPAAPPPGAGLAWGFDLDFRLESDPDRAPYLNLAWMLGFRKSQYSFQEDYQQTASGTMLVGFNAEAIANTSGSPFYLLEIDDFNKNNPTVVDYNCDSKYSFNIKDVIARIPNVSSFDCVIFEDSSDRMWKTRKYFGPVRIKKLRVRLLDDVGRVVDTNDGEFTLTLEITTLNMPYKRHI